MCRDSSNCERVTNAHWQRLSGSSIRVDFDRVFVLDRTQSLQIDELTIDDPDFFGRVKKLAERANPDSRDLLNASQHLTEFESFSENSLFPSDLSRLYVHSHP